MRSLYYIICNFFIFFYSFLERVCATMTPYRVNEISLRTRPPSVARMPHLQLQSSCDINIEYRHRPKKIHIVHPY
uniref:Secreted protein n=1 Tax=Nothobranchius furzeri TaxID=105023 RepID=A0A8C6K879_NOTFU